MTLFLIVSPDGPVIARANRKHHVAGLGIEGDVHTLLPDGGAGVVWDGRPEEAQLADETVDDDGAADQGRTLSDRPKRVSRRKPARQLSDPPPVEQDD